MVNKHNADEIQVDDINQMQYNAIPDRNIWRFGIVKEMIKSGVMVMPDFAHEEITSIIDWICTS